MSEQLQHPARPPLPPSTAAAPPPSTPLSDAKKSAPEPDAAVVVPSYSSWFTWTGIHEVEHKNMPEFFDGKSPSKTPAIYKYYRNAIVKKFRSNSSRKLTFTEVRRTVVGDVGSIRRVFDFLETWGLVNYTPPQSSKQQLKADDKESKAVSAAAAANAAANAAVSGVAPGEGGGFTESSPNLSQKGRRLCSGCKSSCIIACFICEKYDLVLCARCYVRGNYRVGVSSSEFKRVEISEQAKTEWTDKETLQLLEAVMHYGDDWKRVAEHVGRSDKECVARFIKLPFGEQFVEPADLDKEETMSSQIKGQVTNESGDEPDAKKMRLTPLADASNPIMAQAAFLSALAGVEVSEAAARAAVATLYDMGHLPIGGNAHSRTRPSKAQEPGPGSSDNSSFQASEEARVEAELELKREEDEFVKSITTIIDVKMKEIMDKIGRVQEMDLQLEREWQQWHQMKDNLFLDKLTLLFHKAAAPKAVERVTHEIVRTGMTTSN